MEFLFKQNFLVYFFGVFLVYAFLKLNFFGFDTITKALFLIKIYCKSLLYKLFDFLKLLKNIK